MAVKHPPIKETDYEHEYPERFGVCKYFGDDAWYVVGRDAEGGFIHPDFPSYVEAINWAQKEARK